MRKNKPLLSNLLFFILLFKIILAGTVFATNAERPCSLTLVPPSPVSNQITISIRGTVWNKTDRVETYDASIYLDSEEESGLLHKETLTVPAQSAKGIYFRWQTKNHAGKHQIILTAKSGENMQRAVQPLEIRSSDVRSTGVIDGAWSGFYMWGNEGLLWNDAGTHLWMDLETFLFGEYGELYPRPVAGLISDLNRFPNFEKILYFQIHDLKVVAIQ